MMQGLSDNAGFTILLCTLIVCASSLGGFATWLFHKRVMKDGRPWLNRCMTCMRPYDEKHTQG